jgi:hypothetical protein
MLHNQKRLVVLQQFVPRRIISEIILAQWISSLPCIVILNAYVSRLAADIYIQDKARQSNGQLKFFETLILDKE